MQFFGGPQAPLVVYDSAFDRVEDFLALALLFGLDGKGEGRMNSASVSRPDFATAQFIEVIRRFYSGMPNGSGFAAAFPVGMVDGKGAATPAAVTTVLAEKGDDGKPLYKQPLERVNETGDPATVMRNSLSAANPKTALVIVSGPLTNIAKMLALRGGKEMIATNVKLLAVADAGGRMSRDAKAAQFVMAEWPTPIAVCSEEAAASVRYPGASIEKDFAYSKAHPIADVYRAFGTMPYDAPTAPLAAAFYAVRPSSGIVKPAGEGKPLKLTIDPAKTADLVTLYTELASAKPVVLARRGPRAAAAADANGDTPPVVKKK